MAKKSRSSAVPHHHNILAVIIMALFLGAIGLVVWFVQQPQDFRQRASETTNITWTNKANMPFARSSGANTLLGGKIFIIGGGDEKRVPTATVQQYDPNANQWAQLANMQIARKFFGAVTVNEKIYVFGGAVTNSDQAINTVEEYDKDSNTWQYRAPMPIKRASFGVAEVGGKVYLIGGYAQDIYSSFIPGIDVYDPASDTWLPHRSKAVLPTTRSGLGVATVNGKIYAMGGYDGRQSLSTVEEYDPIADTWTTKSPMSTARGSMGVAVVNNKIYVIGGVQAGSGNDTRDQKLEQLALVEEYDPIADTWKTLSPISTARQNPFASAIGNTIYLMGGATNYSFVGADSNILNTTEAGVVGGAETYTPPTSGAPTNVSATASCNGTTPMINITWAGKPNDQFGFWVDIDENPSFTSYSNKNVEKQTSANSVGFSGNFTLVPGKTYYVRVYNGQHSPSVQIKTPSTCVIVPTPTSSETYTPPTMEYCSVAIAVNDATPNVGATVQATVTLIKSTLGYKFDRNTLYEVPSAQANGLAKDFTGANGSYTNNYGGMNSTPPTHTYTFPAQLGKHVLQFAAEAYDGQGVQRTDPFFCSGTATYTGQPAQGSQGSNNPSKGTKSSQ